MKEGKFYNKYRIDTARLYNYDYGQNGAYFVTICTKNREYFFGEIKNGKIQLSKIGKFIFSEWEKTPIIRPGVVLGEFVIMPNHFHAIVIIDHQDLNNVETHLGGYYVETYSYASLQSKNIRLPQNTNAYYQNKFGPQFRNLSAIIRGFKGTTTKNIRSFGFKNFAWQSRFHDRIIRNEQELNNVRNYIINNPKNWREDDYF